MKKTIGLISTNYKAENIGEITAKKVLGAMPFAGRYRLVDFPLSNMSNAGIKTVGLITPHDYRSVVDHVGDGKPWNLDKKCGGLFMLPGSFYGVRSSESKFLLRDYINNVRFFLKSDADYVAFCGSNIVYNIDLKDVIESHEKKKKPITLVYKKVKEAEEHDGLFFEIDKNKLVSGISKNNTSGPSNYFIDCAIINREYLLQMLEWYENLEHMDLFKILEDNHGKVDMNSYEFKGYVGEITDNEKYVKVSMELLNERIRMDLFNPERQIYTKVSDEVPAYIGENAVIKNSLIAAGCVIEGVVEDSILFRNVEIKAGAKVTNSILMRRTVIGEDTRIDNVVTGKYSEISDNMTIKGTQDCPFIVSKYQKM